METITLLTIDNLERTSKSWDKRTKEILLNISGSGNMFGGSGSLLHITLHGDNSMTETGAITINGYASFGYNISRGANGDTSARISYFKGCVTCEDTYNKEPNFKVEVAGSCGGCKEALASILSAELDWKK